MSAIPRTVRCACGWRGPLARRSPCPGCGGNERKRMTPSRITALGAFARGEQPVIAPNQLGWLVRWKLLEATGAAPAPRDSATRGRFQRRPHQVTALGLRVLADDAEQIGATP